MLTFQGTENCPMWRNKETNEHFIDYQNPKNKCKGETRVSAMSSRVWQVQAGKCVSSAWLEYIKLILSQNTEILKIIFDQGTSKPNKVRILKANRTTEQLGLILTLWGVKI